MSDRDTIYFEMRPMGRYVKVSAICGRTGVEVSVVGDAQATQAHLQSLAKQKLKRRLEREKSA
ncbi:DUF6898 family protein [Pseudovibrio exalbescens]|uniref:DUF6898 family protein n=1 Tax=Pseudovibrio exalbescens TaxID=197461 RepID=UPI0004153285|nr:hypothetical protein [Pseudovibrio exalbescens]